jgi:glycosyltransferase involved in cell wall biosynthesis
MTRVLVLAPWPPRTAPSQRFRFEQYLDRLREDGFEFEVDTLLDEPSSKRLAQEGHLGGKAAVAVRAATKRFSDVLRGRSFDIALIHREAFPFGFPLFERALAALGTPYIYDLDDAIYLPPGGRPRFSAFRYRKAGSIARHARLVTAGNSYLAEWAAQHNEDVRVVPTTIDTKLYRPGPSRSDGSPLTVGWSGSHHTAIYLDAVAPVLRDLQRETGVRLRVIGDEDFEIPGAEVEALPWREETELEDLAEIDIGLMPMPDDQWARGKCGLKALQYMALGIPAVISPVGVNVEIASDGAAVLASAPAEWHDAILGLIQSPERRAELASRGRERVEERYSVQATLPLYREALSAAARD